MHSFCAWMSEWEGSGGGGGGRELQGRGKLRENTTFVPISIKCITIYNNSRGVRGGGVRGADQTTAPRTSNYSKSNPQRSSQYPQKGILFLIHNANIKIPFERFFGTCKGVQYREES